jgi:hypothetical protein
MKYAHINENNILLGWYDSDVHDVIPTPNIQVTEDQWQNSIDNNHNKVNADGSTEFVDIRPQEEIDAWNATQYKRDRQVAYKDIEEQLDMQYWDRVNGTDTWKQHIDAVKTAHPKPTE